MASEHYDATNTKETVSGPDVNQALTLEDGMGNYQLQPESGEKYTTLNDGADKFVFNSNALQSDGHYRSHGDFDAQQTTSAAGNTEPLITSQEQ